MNLFKDIIVVPNIIFWEIFCCLTDEYGQIITVIFGLLEREGEHFVLRLEVLDPAPQSLHLNLKLAQLGGHQLRGHEGVGQLDHGRLVLDLLGKVLGDHTAAHLESEAKEKKKKIKINYLAK